MPDTICVDLDGTLCVQSDKYGLDQINEVPVTAEKVGSKPPRTAFGPVI